MKKPISQIIIGLAWLIFTTGIFLYVYEDYSAKEALAEHISAPKHHGAYSRDEIEEILEKQFAKVSEKKGKFSVVDGEFQKKHNLSIAEALDLLLQKAGQ